MASSDQLGLQLEPETHETETPSSHMESSGSPQQGTEEQVSGSITGILPREMFTEIAKHLDFPDLCSLHATCTDLQALLQPDLRKAQDRHGNWLYLLRALKTGDLAAVAAWPFGAPASVRFVLKGRALRRYLATATDGAVYGRMRALNAAGAQYPCAWLEKSGLMVAVEHGQWRAAAFLLRRDGGGRDVGFLGTVEHFYQSRFRLPRLPTRYRHPTAAAWASTVMMSSSSSSSTEDTEEEEEDDDDEGEEKEQIKDAFYVFKPPMWEYFQWPNDHWIGCLFDGGDPVDIDRLLKVIEKREEEAPPPENRPPPLLLRRRI